ncbi:MULTISPECIES: hypothetical protein [Brucella/Ochrobactrum group]|uniref:hypothetical protein n=1 Tax=Brucella/Ochrobactrum group TaxID=2826938 RepID=UPI001C048299|nr:hypothetical protein [Brucella sp. NBRC 12950]QWK81260.1 hypothetical protein KMS41_25830 [Ochrobactrum sp. BTU1]GLU29916.1 hypothetical protein Brsp01_51490 [Brucella sp. NBRC 12950]
MTKTQAILLASTATIASAPAVAASSGGVGDMASNLRTEAVGPIADLIGSLAFVFGVIAGIIGLWMLFQHRRNPHDPNNSVGKAIMSFFVAAGLIGIPSYLGVGVATFFGSGATTTSVDGSLRSIN